MKANYEYKFVRVKRPSDSEESEISEYQNIVNKYAQQGWRLVQVLAPPIGAYGVAPYYDLIFEICVEL